MKFDFPRFKKFKGTQIYKQTAGLAYAFETSHTRVDADGAPNAYHPGDIGRKRAPYKGLDNPANAGYPNTKWWRKVLLPDPKNPKVAYVQPSGPFAGYFVCATALRAPGGDPLDPKTYVDASKVPYVVIPTTFTAAKGYGFWKQGDVGLATFLQTDASVAFIVADAGGGVDAKLGEGSNALYEALGGKNVNARNGAGVLRGDYQYIIFPNSAKPGNSIWPRTNADIAKQVRDLIAQTPGLSAG